MSNKNRHRNWNNPNNKDNRDLHRQGDAEDVVFDDLEAASEPVEDQPIVDLDVDVLENELEEDAVNAKDETVFPEDNISKKLEETQQALEKEKKEYLFLMADFDNFRKRVMKEKADLIKNAAENVLKGLLPIVDDFERGLVATKETTDVQTVREGTELIYNKLVKFLSDNGVKAMDTADAEFNPDIHDAIASVPTGDESKKGKIIDTTQKGYTLNDKVIRHAKVVVGE
ncbi:MAG: nucleotide exchange factor GrpE [Muribaculaceae bacterium]|nr:nucleotide exchange factor GrpE [Muribaculaceae bacterium]